MQEIFKAYKTRCYPNNKQQTLFRMNCGAARWAFNFALERKKAAFDKKERIPTAIDLHKELNKLKGTDKLPWAYAVSKCSFQEGLKDCDKAFANFFRRCKQKVKGKKGFPKFKSKKNNKQSFRLHGAVSAKNNRVNLPRIGKVKLSERDYIKADKDNILSATVSLTASKWFVSAQVKQYILELPKTDKVIGIDLGIKTLATCSDGTTYKNPKALKRNLRKLKLRQKRLSRKKKGSNNYRKTRIKLANLHFRIANIRKGALHKATTQIISENQGIVLENLKVSNMTKNHNLAQAINDASMSEFRRQIEYKAKWHGRDVQFADTFYPSSKTCCKCGWKNDELTLSDRTFKCQVCDNSIDRDLNASINLKKLYNTVSSTEIYALGDGSPACLAISKFSPSLKKEFNGEFSYTLR